MLESIEVAFRTHISYLIAHKYGPLGYNNSDNFKNRDYHKSMMKKFDDNVERSDETFILHHKEIYEGKFPAWVLMEIISFGDLSKMYNNMLDKDKEQIAKSYYGSKGHFVATWLHAQSTLRNRCAHYSRLYGKKLNVTPKLYNLDRKKGIENDTVFAVIYVMGRLSRDSKEWELFIGKLVDLFDRYSLIDLSQIGFPEIWEKILKDI